MAERFRPPPREKVYRALMLKESLVSQHSARDQMIQDMRLRRQQDRPVKIADAYRGTTQEVRLPLLADAVDLMVAICDDAPRRIHVEPFDVTSTAERNSALRERWSEAMFEQVEMELGRPAITLATANQLGDGLGVLKTIYTPDSWQGLPSARSLFGKEWNEVSSEESSQLAKEQERRKRGLRLPFRLLDIDPLTYYPVYGPDGETEAVCEITERPVRDLLALYPNRIGWDTNSKTVVPLAALGQARARWNPAERFTDATVNFWEYWDREITITFVEDVPVFWLMHGCGEVPYFDCYARPSPSRDPEVRSRPSTYKQIWLLDLLDSFWTMMSNAGYLYAYPTPVTETPQEAAVPIGTDGRPDAIQWQPGRHVTLYPGQKFSFVTPPVEHINLMSQLIAQATRIYESSSGLGPALRGIGGGDQAGYAINQLIQASMLSLHPAIKSRDIMLSRVIAYIWRLVERRVEETVWVWGKDPSAKAKGAKWLGLGPNDIRGYYRVRVESKPLVDQMRISRGQFAAAMVKAELLDRRRAIEEYLGYENPDDVLDAIEVDKQLAQGPLHDMMADAALKRSGIMPPPPPPAPNVPGLPPGGPPGAPPGAPPLPGLPNALPASPGQGMPLAPPRPPGPTAGQMAEFGSSAMPPGRAPGADRMPPTQPPGQLVPDQGR